MARGQISGLQNVPGPGRPWAVLTGCVALVLFALISIEFVGHAASLGWTGLTGSLGAEHRLFWPEAPIATAAIFAHMIAGALITALAPLQLLGPVRRRWPRLHRLSGRVLALAGVFTGLAGLVYIAGRGTIGGPDMSLSFALYGTLLVLCAVQAVRHARLGQYARHRRWALRFAVLAVGSWLYRLHYGLWFAVTDGAGVREDFSGAFDLVNIWAFYMPYLLALELLFAREGRPARQTSRA